MDAAVPSVQKNAGTEQERASQRRWFTPIGQKVYVWRAGSGGRIRIQLFFRARENVSIFWAAGPKKSEIGAVLSALDGFVVASINRQRAVRLLSRILTHKLTLLLLTVVIIDSN